MGSKEYHKSQVLKSELVWVGGEVIRSTLTHDKGGLPSVEGDVSMTLDV